MVLPARRDLSAADPVAPSIARVHALLLGDDAWAFPADRTAAEQFLAAEPLAGQFAVEARDFLGRAVSWVGGHGVRQYVDLGAGLPVRGFPPIHEIAREHCPDARVAYVDNDPVAVEAMAGAVAGMDGAAALLADVRDPACVMRAAEVAGIDLAVPVCLVMGLVLEYLPADHARAVMRRFAELICPGSYVVVSVARATADRRPRLAEAFRSAAPAASHPRDEVTAWLTGLDIVAPGMADARAWHPGQPAVSVSARGAEIWAGVGRKPSHGAAAPADSDDPAVQAARLSGPPAGPTAPGPLSPATWRYADWLLGGLPGKWDKVVLRYLSPDKPGIRPGELLRLINTAPVPNRGTLSLNILLERLGHLVDQGLAERSKASGHGTRRITYYRLTDDKGRDALAALRRLAGATAGPESGLPRPAEALRNLDTSRPSIARVYDYLLGGKDNFRADRDQAEKIMELIPATATLARENREFLRRAVGYVAQQGVRQFIDIGAGLPTSPAVHEIAREHVPDPRVVYVDNDPMAIAHASALLAGNGVAAVAGDMKQPDAVLASPALTRLIDLNEPTCLILAMVIHFIDPAETARVVGGFTSALPAGSYVVMSVGNGHDDRLSSRVQSAYTAARLHRHSRAQVASYFAGFTLVSPGLTEARNWPARRRQDVADDRGGYVLAGVARKP